MDLFTLLAQKTIRAGPDDRRLLDLHGPFARPYDVSGPDTEERIVRRLACAYRALMMPVLVVVLFLSGRPSVHFWFWASLATAFVGWLAVRAFLQPELRYLRRVERRSYARPNDDDFARQLEPSERAVLRRRRRANLVGFLMSCTYLAFGLVMIPAVPALGYFAAVFWGICAIRWWKVVVLPPEAVLQTPSLDEFVNVLWPQASASAPRHSAKPAPRRPNLESAVGLWDAEIDGCL